MTTILEAMQQAIDLAAAPGNRYEWYLYQNDLGYYTSIVWQKDWLFKVYPGGRKVLSKAGISLVKDYLLELGYVF